MAITSPEKGWLRMNDRLCDLLGYSRKELSRMTWAEITHPDDLEADVAQFARLVNGEIDGYEMEKRFVRKDGKTVYTRLGVSCSRREDGSIDHVQAMLDDVSERKKLQAELETERRQLKTLFDAQDEAIYVSDPETFELLYANRVIRENWSEDAIGKKCYRVLQNRGEPCPFCTNGLIFQDGENRTHAWEFRNEVTGRWYRCVDKAIRWPDGRRVRFEIASDITEQKKLEEERVSLDKLSSLGRLAAGVAHELNNPLMGILNYAQYCLTVAEPGSRMNEVLRDIETETRRGLELVGNLLSFSRTKTGTGPHGGETRTPAVFRNVVKLLAYRIRNENVAVHEEFGPGAAQARVNGATVQQVLMNLLSNALDAVESAKTKEVRVAFRKEANALVLEVADTGCGIPPEVRERIFEPFYTTKPPGKGTGLGLSILGALVHDAGGRILCRSRPGEGTVMTVELPERTADPSKKTKKKSVRGKREENHP
jgi:PAS domain S-box-containing protein